MEKNIPYEKLSKKEKRKLDSARRGTWGELNPVTRKPENSRAYNRKKMLKLEEGTSQFKHLFILRCHWTAAFSLFIRNKTITK